MKICDISTDGNSVLFDGVECGSADDAYVLFRRRYNENVGKAFKKALGHRGLRTERISGYGIEFEDAYIGELREMFGGEGKQKSYMMGLVGISYCRMFSTDGMPEWCDDDAWLDWVMSSDRNLRTFGRREGTGRTSVRYTNRRKYGRKKERDSEGGTEVHL